MSGRTGTRAPGFLVVLERSVERDSPPRWPEWADREPVLAGLGYTGLRATLRWGSPERRDELCLGLVRLAQGGDRTAGMLLVVCLRPGIAARVRRYRGPLSSQDAYGEMVAGLWQHIASYDNQTHPEHVAGRLLDRAAGRLRRRAAHETRYREHNVPLENPDGAGPHSAKEASEPGPGLPVGVLLDGAVKAGVISAADAALILAVDVHGVRLRTAARWAGCSYQAAVKRRQRALARLATYLTDDHQTGTIHGDQLRGAA